MKCKYCGNSIDMIEWLLCRACYYCLVNLEENPDNAIEIERETRSKKYWKSVGK